LARAGGYGRLGQNTQTDVMSPAVVEAFNAAKNPRCAATMICAGATCTYALNRAGQVSPLAMYPQRVCTRRAAASRKPSL
jgi:di/tricarboxylate transporter